MKKTVLSVLIVLLLSVVLFGCGGKECEVCGEVDCICQATGSETIPNAVLTDLGITAADVLAPQGTTYHDYKKGAAAFIIYWKDANQSMYNYYKDAWLALPDRAQVISEKSTFSYAQIDYLDEGGQSQLWLVSYPEGTISFTANKTF